MCMLSYVRVTLWTMAHHSAGIFQARILEWVAISLLQRIFLTQGSDSHFWHLLHWQADS